MMMQKCEKPLKTNPFTTYRDPETGRWITLKNHSSTPVEAKVA